MLEKELETFKAAQQQLQKEYPDGGVVVIYGNDILGVWAKREDALKAGYTAFGKVAFLAKNIQDDLNKVHYLFPY